MSDSMKKFFEKMREEMQVKTIEDLLPYVAQASEWLHSYPNDAKEMCLFVMVIQNDLILRNLEAMKKVALSEANTSMNMASSMAQNWESFLDEMKRRI